MPNIGVLFKLKQARFVPLISQSVGVCCTHITNTYVQNGQGNKIGSEHGVFNVTV